MFFTAQRKKKWKKLATRDTKQPFCFAFQFFSFVFQQLESSLNPAVWGSCLKRLTNSNKKKMLKNENKRLFHSSFNCLYESQLSTFSLFLSFALNKYFLLKTLMRALNLPYMSNIQRAPYYPRAKRGEDAKRLRREQQIWRRTRPDPYFLIFCPKVAQIAFQKVNINSDQKKIGVPYY